MAADTKFTKLLLGLGLRSFSVSSRHIPILKYGRHFRYKGAKIIVGRNETENNLIIQLKKPEDLIMEAKDIMGPTTIIQGYANDEILEFAGKLTLRYSDLIKNIGDVIYGETSDSLSKHKTLEKADENLIKTYIL